MLYPHGTAERSRTLNLLIRSQALYPIELRPLKSTEDRARTCTSRLTGA